MRRKRLSARGLAVRDRLGFRFGDESGMALVMALGIMLVLTIVLTTVIAFTAAGARDSHRVNAGQKSYALAEAGLNNALAVLNDNYPCTSCYPGDPTLLPTRTTAYSTGSVTWSGTLEIAPLGYDWSDEWRITSVSTVPNPTGPGAAPIQRTVTAVVPIIVPATAPIGNDNPLNYIYAKGDLSFLQSVIVASPVYATNDLHLENSSTVSEFIGNVPGIKNRLAVGGVLYAAQNANRVGHVNGATSPAYNLEKAYIVGGCNTKKYDNNVTTHNPCVYGDGSNIDQIWADAQGNVIPPGFIDYVPELTCCAPYPFNALLGPASAGTADSTMGSRYKAADLGPRSPCTTGSVPFTFDGAGGLDSQINNSATPTGSSAIDLTPNSTYSCKSARGELSWNNSTKILRVQGTVFIDGSVTISSSRSAQARVTGQGSVFLTGTFMMKNALLCVKTTGNGNNTKCDTSQGAWDPNIGALIVVADGDGGYDVTQNQSNNVNAGEGINLKTAYFQGGLVANKDINVATTSEMQGPMLSVYNDVFAGQSNVLTFPPIAFAPGGGANLGPPPLAQLLPPRQFVGG